MTYNWCRVGLIVTGEGEERFLEYLFRTIMSRANCKFEVIRRFPQLSPITSPKKLKVTGADHPVMSRDEELGLAAWGYLRRYPCSLVVVIDDLEGARRDIAPRVFQRYRSALDSVLQTAGCSNRAAVHFLVNMLDAYYFADVKAVNAVAGSEVLTEDYPTDVEDIGHPKGQLRAVWRDFHEIHHGERIVKALDLEHVLSRSEECRWLRSLFGWCVDSLATCGVIFDESLNTAFCAPHGRKETLTYPQ